MSFLDMTCDREGCPDPENVTGHYHCGHCTSPAITSMLGHYLMVDGVQAFQCKPADIEAEQVPSQSIPERDIKWTWLPPCSVKKYGWS